MNSIVLSEDYGDFLKKTGSASQRAGNHEPITKSNCQEDYLKGDEISNFIFKENGLSLEKIQSYSTKVHLLYKKTRPTHNKGTLSKKRVPSIVGYSFF